MSRETDITVLGGLPVNVEFDIEGADPDVGIMSSYVSDWWITHVNGRPVKNADWIMKRLNDKDQQKVLDELNELAYDDGYDDYYEKH